MQQELFATERSKKSALVVLSGGQDSTTCLFWALKHFDKVFAITFDYHQRHNREITSAQYIAAFANVPHAIVEIGPVLRGASPLISTNELEQYKDHHSLPGGLEKTFVPMRNQLFLTIAANHAYSLGITDLVTGVCEEDYGGYPDCRQVFIDAFMAACNAGTFTGEPGTLNNLTVHTPLMKLTKAQTVQLATTLEGCYAALAFTHTSYDGQYPPTGSDHATLLRAKGFEEAGLPDPLVMRAASSGLMQLPPSQNYSPLAIQAANNLIERDAQYILKDEQFEEFLPQTECKTGDENVNS